MVTLQSFVGGNPWPAFLAVILLAIALVLCRILYTLARIICVELWILVHRRHGSNRAEILKLVHSVSRADLRRGFWRRVVSKP